MSLDSRSSREREEPRETKCGSDEPGNDRKLSGKYARRTSSGTEKRGEVTTWTVGVATDHERMVHRYTWNCNTELIAGGGTEDWAPERVIWPPSFPMVQGNAPLGASPLEETQDYWHAASERLRDAAKWLAAVLGGALAVLIGTSPLATMREAPRSALITGVAGLSLLAITMLLILQVLRPQSVSFVDVQTCRWSKSFLKWVAAIVSVPGPGETVRSYWRQRPWHPLRRWSTVVEGEQDIYLPTGIDSLTHLRQAMIVEEVTLVALARAIAADIDCANGQCPLQSAQQACTGRLDDLRNAASRISLIGEFYCLRRKSAWASYAGALSAFAGTACIIAAFTL